MLRWRIPVRSRPARVLATVVLALVATGTVLGALELGLRLAGVETASYHAIGGFTVYDSQLGWRLAPSRELVFRGPGFAVRVAHNAEGLRDRHYDYARAPGRRRMLVLGDSFVWCWGVELTDCFTERLEAGLPGTDVINTGVPAWSTAQEMLFYEREGRRYAPDVVLLVFVPNDPVENVRGWGPRFRLDGDRLVATNVPVPRRKGALGEWLQARSRLYAEVTYRLAVARESLRYGRARGRPTAPPPANAAEAAYVPAAPPRTSPAWAVTAALLDRLSGDVTRDGARFAVAAEEMPPAMATWLRDLLAARRIPYVELGPALAAAARRGERVRLSPDPHLAPAGQRVVAETLAAFLAERGLLAR